MSKILATTYNEIDMDKIKPHEFIPDFGLSSAQLHRNYREMQERISGAMGWSGVYESIDDVKDFYSYSATALINNTKLTSVSNSRIYTKAISDNASAIFLPTAGEQSTSIVNDKRIDWGVNSVGLYAPPGERIGYAGSRSVLIMDIDHQRMKNILNTMIGRDVSIQHDLNDPQTLSLTYGQVDFVQNFKQICQQIDLYSSNPRLLELSGLDDQLYRMAACWMFPHLVLEADIETQHNNAILKRVKDYVYANLNRHITLTELENLAGVSRRTLQYLFLKSTQKSPLQWIREQRLMKAYEMLNRAKSDDTVTDVAMYLGFYSAAQFSKLYKQKFGVSPSAHLTKR